MVHRRCSPGSGTVFLRVRSGFALGVFFSPAWRCTMTPLRQRFLDDLRLRNYARRTIDSHVGHIPWSAGHFGRSPAVLVVEDVRAYQLPLLQRRVSWSTFSQAVCALRFLYRITLGRPDDLPFVPFGKRPRTLPSVLSPDEVLRLIN